MKTLKTLRSKFAAFTLIELLVVISIIAVLASLALPAVTGALAKGQIAQTTSNYRQAYVLTQSASLDSQQGGGPGAFPGDLTGSNSVSGWVSALVPAYCSQSTLSNLVSVKGAPSNTQICTDIKSSSDPASVFLAVAGITSSGTNGVKYNGTGPYAAKGGALVTVGGAAISFVGTNSAVLNNGTVLMASNGTAVTFQ